MMSCLQLNTPESFNIASDIFDKTCDEKQRKSSRIAHPYAFLAYQQGDLKKALEIVEQCNSQSVLRKCLQVFFLTKLQEYGKALSKLDKLAKKSQNQNGNKIIFSVEVVRNLTQEIQSNSDKSLHVKLAQIFLQLDSVASISEKSMFDLITDTIDVTNDMKYRREKNRIASQQS